MQYDSIIKRRFVNLKKINEKCPEQRTNPWYYQRYNMITASDVATALNSNRYQTSRDLLEKKCKSYEIPSHEGPMNLNIEWGVKFEPIAHEIYEDICKTDLYEFGLMSHPIYPWLGASPDGVREDGIMVEIKCPRNRQLSLEIPYMYWIQMQIQMEVCNLYKCHYFDCKFVKCTEEEYLNNLEHNKKNVNKIYTGLLQMEAGPLYWQLDDYKLTTVDRDSKWFKNSLKELKIFWDNVKKIRKIPEENRDISSFLGKRHRDEQTKRQSKKSRSDKPIMTVDQSMMLVDQSSIDWSTWVSATKTRNYMMKDTILDWLDQYCSYKSNSSPRAKNAPIYANPDDKPNDFTSFIMAQGVHFEKRVIDELYKNPKFTNNIVTIANTYQSQVIEKFQDTVNAMQQGIPIIYQGVLHDYEEKIYGMPDLLVRSDWVNKLVLNKVMTVEEENIHSGHNPWHYVVIDIKFSTVNFKADGQTILNSGSAPAYKAQVYLYNKILGKIQGYVSKKGFIIGRKYSCDSANHSFSSNNCFNFLGTIKFFTDDIQFSNKAEEAVSWIKRMREEGSAWTLTPPSVPELYPNMVNMQDNPWHKVKEQLANELSDITCLWNCGPKNRRVAHENGIFKWTDPNCTAKSVGISGPKTGPILEAILNINKPGNDIRNTEKVISPDIITNNKYSWKQEDNLELFVDFESVNDIVSDLEEVPFTLNRSMIFMVGVGWIDKQTGKWTYKDFTVNRLTQGEEERILNEFYSFVEYLMKHYSQPGKPCSYPNMYHWGHAEPSQIKGAKDRRYKSHSNWNVNCYKDLLKLFKEVPIVVKGSLSFGLKGIAKAMYKNGLIKTTWNETSTCSDGMGAMVAAWKCNKEAERRGISMKHLPTMRDIVLYNEIDCKVLWEILTYLRSNHT